RPGERSGQVQEMQSVPDTEKESRNQGRGNRPVSLPEDGIEISPEEKFLAYGRPGQVIKAVPGFDRLGGKARTLARGRQQRFHGQSRRPHGGGLLFPIWEQPLFEP